MENFAQKKILVISAAVLEDLWNLIGENETAFATMTAQFMVIAALMPMLSTQMNKEITITLMSVGSYGSMGQSI